MHINTNRWNKIRYTAYAPVYDLVGRLFNRSRKSSIAQLAIQKSDRVLLVGAGTGLDLQYLPKDCFITATDLTPSMVEKIKQRSRQLNIAVDARVMDGQQLTFHNAEFDKIILHLILAVIPDPVRCLQEAERVLKPGGRIAIFDKFLPPGQKTTLKRRMLNKVANTLFSDINRSVEAIVQQTNLKIISDQQAGVAGNYRVLILEKQTTNQF